MLDPVLNQFLFEPDCTLPVGILSSVVGEHLLGHAVTAQSTTVGLDDILGGLAAVAEVNFLKKPFLEAC